MKKKKRLFRFHKGLLDESMKTVVEVKNLKDIELRVMEYYGDFGAEINSVEIDTRPMCDEDRLGSDWKDTYYVIGHTEDTKFVAGMCNFYEDKTCRYPIWKKYLWYVIYILYVVLAIIIFSSFALCSFIGNIGKRIYRKCFEPVLDNIKYNLSLWD